jgi:hypothetical protein
MSASSFQVTRTNLAETQFIELQDAESSPPPGEVIIKVDKFALTANNITYGVAGDLIGYWQFFPSVEPWGQIPVWGTGTVLQTGHPDIAVGDRYYGYYPMASYLKVKPEKISSRGFTDAADHRSKLPVVYNQYARMSEENGFADGKDDHQMIYKPLFTTSFVLDDFLDDNNYFDADNIILSSASSKTSFGLAFLLNQSGKVSVTGLTSAANKSFVENLGIYDQVMTYDELEQMSAQQKAVYVDMAGNRSVLARIHHHFKENMVCSCGVGITHWEDRDGEAPASLPGAKPTMFFAPSQIQKRHKDWGPELYQSKLSQAWDNFLGKVDDWVSIVQGQGENDIQDIYQRVLNGAPPSEAYVLTFDK